MKEKINLYCSINLISLMAFGTRWRTGVPSSYSRKKIILFVCQSKILISLIGKYKSFFFKTVHEYLHIGIFVSCWTLQSISSAESVRNRILKISVVDVRLNIVPNAHSRITHDVYKYPGKYKSSLVNNNSYGRKEFPLP